MTRRVLAISLIAAAALAAAVLPAVSASAEVPTSVQFTETGLTTPYGADWLTELQVASSWASPDGAGEVNVFVDDQPAAYASGLPVVGGGTVYLANPAAAAPLAVGDHRLTAYFQPHPDTGLDPSQSTTQFIITVTALAATAQAAVLDVPGDEASPYLELSVVGDYVDALGTPAGSWNIVATRGGDSVLEQSIEVEAGSGPTTLSLAEYTRPGTTLGVEAEFVPDAEVAPTLTLTAATPVEVQTPAVTPVDWLTSAILLPWWAVAVIILVVLGAIVAAVLIPVSIARRRRAAAEVDPPTDAPSDPPLDPSTP